MSSEVGSGQVAIFPVFKGFRKAVASITDSSAKDAGKGFQKTLGKSGLAAGRSAGEGVKQGFNSSGGMKAITAAVASAAKAVSASRLKEQDAAGKLRVAEVQLTEARSKGAAGSARVVAAEERVATAQRNLKSVQDTVRDSSTRLQSAQTSLANATVTGNQRATTSVRAFLTASLRRGANLGVVAGGQVGSGFLGGFKKALGPIAGIAAGYIGLQALSRGIRSFTGYIKDSITAIGNWQVLNAQSAAVVRSTGGAARVSAKHIHNLAQNIESLTATQAEDIQNGANLIATFKGIRNQAGKNNKIYDQTVLASVDMARALGKDVPSAALMLGKALNDPTVGLSKLSRAGVMFTQQQKDQIKALQASGNIMGAQKIILKELNSEFGKSGAAYADTLPGKLYTLRDAFGDVGEHIATGITPSLGKFIGFASDGLKKLNDSPFLKSFIRKISGVLDTATGKAQAVKGLLDRLSKTSEGVTFAGVTSGLKDILPQLSPLFGVLEIVGPALKQVLASVGPQLSAALIKIAPAFVDLLKALLPLVPPLTDLIVKLVPPLVSLLGLIVPILIPIIDEVGKALQVITAMITFIGDPSTTGLAKFNKSLGSIGGVFAFLIGITNNVAKVLGDYLGHLILNFRQFQAGATSAVRGVISFFSGLPGAIGNAVSGAGKWLIGTGKAIVDGLIKGIKGAIGGVTDVVKDLGKSALDGLKDFLGIRSPSKRFETEVGVQIPAGVAKGVRGKASQVAAELRAMVNPNLAFSNGVAAASSVAASASSSGPMRITGTLDLGNGLRGFVDGVLAEYDAAAQATTIGRKV